MKEKCKELEVYIFILSNNTQEVIKKIQIENHIDSTLYIIIIIIYYKIIEKIENQSQDHII